MTSHRGSFDHICLEDRETVSGYLDAIRAGLARGSLRLAAGEKELQLMPPALLQVRLAVEAEGGRTRLLLEITWQESPGREGRPPERLAIRPGGPA